MIYKQVDSMSSHIFALFLFTKHFKNLFQFEGGALYLETLYCMLFVGWKRQIWIFLTFLLGSTEAAEQISFQIFCGWHLGVYLSAESHNRDLFETIRFQGFHKSKTLLSPCSHVYVAMIIR